MKQGIYTRVEEINKMQCSGNKSYTITTITNGLHINNVKITKFKVVSMMYVHAQKPSPTPPPHPPSLPRSSFTLPYQR